MKRLYYIILVCFMILTAAQAQELTVKSMTVAGNDISASQYERKDLNGKPCALVKVQLAAMGAVFEGNVIGKADYKTGEYWVYMTAGSKELHIKHPSFVPLAVQFSNYGIKGVDSKATYVLTLLMPQGATAPVQTQKLTINYSPANAMVLIDNKVYKGSGQVETTLSVGTHNYIIAAEGYETIDDVVKLTANAPRTISESLVALSGTQGTVVVQQANQAAEEPPQQSIHNSEIETFTVNGVSFNMVRVEGGTFTMGATPEQDSDAYNDEKPAHQVTLSTYSIGETEVTQVLWRAVMGSNPSRFKGDNLPVESVNWDDCQIFINKLNELTGKKFRLPTEAEWEYAARGGSKGRGYKYSGSNNIDDIAWYSDNSGKQTHAVKSKQPNELGIFDLAGNVLEWCQDGYDKKYYKKSSQSNPIGSSSGSNRVLRGGCWIVIEWGCRSSCRYEGESKNRYDYLGLRLAL